MVVNIIDELTGLGLSRYEAIAYSELLRSVEPLGAYELAKRSQIPTSKIYEVIGKLEERGIFQPVETGSVKKYAPLDPEELIARHRQKTESSLGRLSSGLSSLKNVKRDSMIYNIGEYNHLIDRASRMIDGAGSEVLVSAWGQEFTALADAVRKAEKRRVKAAVVHFGEKSERGGQVYIHPIADTIYSEKGGRGLVVVADSREALVGTVHNDGSVEGGFSGNSGFVTLAEDYIKHDIYIMKIVNRYDDELKRRFGDNYKMLREIFSDREVKG